MWCSIHCVEKSQRNGVDEIRLVLHDLHAINTKRIIHMRTAALTFFYTTGSFQHYIQFQIVSMSYR